MLSLRFADTAHPRPVRFGRQVNAWADDCGRPFARAFCDSQGYRIEWFDLACFSLPHGRTAVDAWPDAAASPLVVSDVFGRVVQPLLLQLSGKQSLHASAILSRERAIIFCGESGAGKSTLAFAAGRHAACVQVADDVVVFEADDSGAVVHEMPFRPRLRPHTEAHFGLSPVPPTRTVDDGPRRSWPIAALLLLAPREDGPSSVQVDSVPPRTAFRKVLAHAHCLDPQDRAVNAAMVEAFLALAAGVPVYALSFRRDFSSLDALVRAALNTGEPRG
jgi:hypothetical protein